MARLTIHTDIDCNIYVDTEYYGIAKADTDYSIELSSGVYWIECRSIDDNIPLYDFDFNAYDSSVGLRKDISLLNSLRHKLLKARYDTVGEFIYGYARVQDKGVLIGYIDSTYQFLYDDVLVLCENVLCVRKNGMYGILNDGKEVIPIKYTSISLLGNKLLRLELNNHFGLADLEGRKLTPLKYKIIEYVMNNVYALYYNEWQFVDYRINTVATPGNVLLYTSNNNKPLTIERKFGYEKYITYDSAFNQKPFLHLFDNGTGIIVFENYLESIGNDSFSGCESLTSVTIPSNVISIGEGAFEDCRNIKNINLPKSVKSIGGGAFCHCQNLVSINLPETLEIIKEYTFYGCGEIKNIVIPESITTIEKFAFKGCVSLMSISIPQSVTTIGKSAFENCINLQDVHITSLEAWCNIFFTYNQLSNPLHNTNARICINGENIEELIIPKGVEKINKYAFWGCENLKEINIQESVRTIGEFAFVGCNNLIKTTIPHSVTVIGEGAFAGCAGDLFINCDIPACFATLHEYNDESYSGVSIAEIGCSFEGANFSRVHIGDDVHSIGSGAFKGCDNIEKFAGKFVEDNGRCIIIDGELIAVIANNLIEYKVPKKVKQIGAYAFDNSNGLAYVVLPKSVETIGAGAFYNCRDLKTVFCESPTPADLLEFYELYSMNSYMMPSSDDHFSYSLRNICVPVESVNRYKEEWNEYEDKIVGYNF